MHRISLVEDWFECKNFCFQKICGDSKFSPPRITDEFSNERLYLPMVHIIWILRFLLHQTDGISCRTKCNFEKNNFGEFVESIDSLKHNNKSHHYRFYAIIPLYSDFIFRA